jgi:predicted  nucleic acid-binding Zn-ribbon protein
VAALGLQPTAQHEIEIAKLKDEGVATLALQPTAQHEIDMPNLKDKGVTAVQLQQTAQHEIEIANLKDEGVATLALQPAAQHEIDMANLEDKRVATIDLQPTVQNEIDAPNLKDKGVATVELQPAVRHEIDMANLAVPDQMSPNQTPALRGKYYESLSNEDTKTNEDTESNNAGSSSEGTDLNYEGGSPEEIEQYEKAKRLKDNLEKPSSILGLPHGIAEVCLKELCFPIDGPGNTQFPVMNLVELQRLNIYALREKLADKAIHIVKNKSLSDFEVWWIKGLMSDYCERLFCSLSSDKAFIY